MFGKHWKRNIVILVCIIITASFTGCNMLRPPAPKEDGVEKKKNPPKALTQMEKETDGIIQDLEEVREKRARQLREQENPSRESQPEAQQQAQQQEQQGQEQQQNGENQEQQGEGEQQQNQEQQQSEGEQQQGQKPEQPKPTEQPIPEPDWNNLESTLETLHEHWNSYEPVAKTDGAMNETMKGFREQLISLTEQIMARNEEQTLVAANSLYSYFSEFLKLYTHNQPPEIKELRGLARQVIQYGQQEKWEETKPLLDQMKKAWQEAKTKMKKPDKTLNGRIEAALNDFQLVVSAKKINLARIKGNILIKNLDQVE